MSPSATSVFEYLLFLGASLGLFIFLEIHNRRVFCRRIPRHVWVILILLLAIAHPVAKSISEREHKQIKRMLEGFAPTYALEMKKFGHELINLRTPANDPLYLSLIQTQIEWLKTNPAIADIYTLRKLPDGKLVIILDSETDYNKDGKITGERESRTSIGEVLNIVSPELNAAFQGHVTFDPTPATDRWGTWISAYAPIYDHTGKIDAILGIDYPASHFLHAHERARRIVLGIFFLAVVAIGATVWIFSRLRWSLSIQQQTEERLRMALAAGRQGVFDVDTKTGDGFWSDSCYSIIGYNHGDFSLATDFMEKIHPDDFTRLASQVEAHLRSGTPFLSAEFRARHRNGQWIWLEGRLTATRQEPNAKGMRILGSITDITEHKKLETQLIHSAKLATIGTLAAGVAHEINNPMTIIKGNLFILNESLSEAKALSNETSLLFDKLNTAVDRITKIVNNLRTFARPDTETTEVVDFHKVLQETLAMVQKIIEKSGITVETRLSSKNPRVKGNAGKFQQVLLNLLTNARDALEGRKDAKIVIETADVSGNLFTISVTDNGSGIPEDHLHRVFDPFFTTKAPGKGTGLGLSISRSLVEDAGGSLHLESEVGRGTSFSIILPVALSQRA